MSLLFSMLSRLVIAFLLRSKHLLISWLQAPSTVILEPPKIKSITVSIVSPSICHEVMGLDAGCNKCSPDVLADVIVVSLPGRDNTIQRKELSLQSPSP